MVKPDSNYWQEAGDALVVDLSAQAIWRAHSDAVNGAWVAERLPHERTGRLLKTDVFDEAVSDGLHALLTARARSVVGIDLSPAIARRAQPRCAGWSLLASDVRELPIAAQSFDVVVSISTLDHFATRDEIGKSLCELRRILRPGGLLLLTLDNGANPVVALRNLLPFSLLHSLGVLPYRVGVTCTPRALQALLRDVGFEVRETSAILHCPRVLAVAWAKRLERHGTAESRQLFRRRLMSFERLATSATRFLTGYFIGIVARRC